MYKKLLTVTLASGLVLAGCTTDPNTGEQRLNKAAIGALAGAAGGAVISKATGGDHTGRDAAIGAALGAGVGAYMEKQARQIERDMAGTGVQVSQNPQTGNIDLVMPGNITFAFDDSRLNPSFMPTLDKLANTMNQYRETTVNVSGYTDSIGNPNYNLKLSRERASSVANYLISRGVSANRIHIYGYGMSNPIADNSTEYGRQQNRRVEITINAPSSL